ALAGQYSLRRVQEVVDCVALPGIAVPYLEIRAVGRRAGNHVADVLLDSAGRILGSEADDDLVPFVDTDLVQHDRVHVVIGALLDVLEVDAEPTERTASIHARVPVAVTRVHDLLDIEIDDRIRRLKTAPLGVDSEIADRLAERHERDRAASDRNL